jgi:hypothetical protein
MVLVYNISLYRSASFVHVRFDDRRRSICSMFNIFFPAHALPISSYTLFVSLSLHDIPHCFYAGHLNTSLINTPPLVCRLPLSFNALLLLCVESLNIEGNLDNIHNIFLSHAYSVGVAHNLTYTDNGVKCVYLFLTLSSFPSSRSGK